MSSQTAMTRKKKNVILDLDQTLICAESLQEFNVQKNLDKIMTFDSTFNPEKCETPSSSAKEKKIINMEDMYVVFLRPNVQEFLDYLFENFNVSVWTAASKEYASFIVNKVILEPRPDKKLDLLLFSYHCNMSRRHCSGSKNLCLLWDVVKLPGFTKENTVILDDFCEVFDIQPSNCIRADEFQFNGSKSPESDNFLKDVIIPKLERFRLME